MADAAPSAMGRAPLQPISPQLCAEIADSPRRALRKAHTRDRSSPEADAQQASLRRAVAPELLNEVRTSFSGSTEAFAPTDGATSEMEVWVPDDDRVWARGFVVDQVDPHPAPRAPAAAPSRPPPPTRAE